MEKKYKIVFNQFSLEYEQFQLTPISLEICSGERVAVMGDSGAGKTSFLQSIQDIAGLQDAAGLLEAEGVQSAESVQSAAGVQSAGSVQSAAGAQAPASSQDATSQRTATSPQAAEFPRATGKLYAMALDNTQDDNQNDSQNDTPANILTVYQEPKSVLNPLKRVHTLFRHLAKSKKFPSDAEMNLRYILRQLNRVGLLKEYENDAKSLSQLLHKRSHELSGGMAQRIMLAMVLAMSPDFLLADEITSALDSETEEAIMDVLIAHAPSIIMVTHRLHLVQKYFDRIIFLLDGKILFDGTRDAFLESKEPEIQSYIENLLLSDN